MHGSPASSHAPATSGRFARKGGHLLALAVLLGALFLVLGAWHILRGREVHAARVEFEAQTGAIIKLLQQRLIHYELLARGGASLFASVEEPTPEQWRAYVDGMDLQQRFGPVAGLGYAARLRASELDQAQARLRVGGHGRIEVFPRGVRETYGPIVYLEPRGASNRRAMGFDMYSEPTRRQAMQLAIDTGNAHLTGAVHLVQDTDARTTGLLLFLPVYRGGDRPRSLEARRDTAQGWVYIPFRMRAFVSDAIGIVRPGIQFRIYDVTGGSEELLFTNAFRGDDAPAAFRYSRTIEQYGRDWRIDFDSPPIARAAPRVEALNNALALGVLAAFLMYGIAWMLARTEARASAIAVRLTEDFRRSEQRFRAAMEHSAIGMALLDSEGRVVESNRALAETVGRSPDELIGVVFDSMLEPSEDRNEPQPPSSTPVTPVTPPSTSSSAGEVQRTTRRLGRGDGVLRHVQLTYSPVPGNVGQDITRMVHVEDVTERLRAEARIHALNRTLEARVALRTRELSQANHELESFAYSVSHDLRAPLRAIEGFSRILVERYGPSLDDPGRDYLGRVRRAAARMGELIDAMLKMSRMTRGEMRPAPVDLSRLAGEVADEVQADEPARDVQWRIAPGLDVVGDSTLLRNLLSNLLGNAFKFTRGREPALIEFGRTPDEAGGEFFVRDNGAGFSQEYVDKLFRPFQRLHSQEEFAGHGIGLATVKRIVERHGGAIRAEGAPGEGATFYFTLGDAAPAGGA